MISPAVQMEAEFSVPQWQFRASTYAFASASRILCTYSQYGLSHLASIDIASGKLEVIEMPYTDMGSIQAGTEQAVFLAASPTEFASVVQMDLTSGTISELDR
jgi:hypothetical protein